MITKLCKAAVTLFCLAAAKDLIETEKPLVKEDTEETTLGLTNLEWVGFGLGSLMGVLLDFGSEDLNP